MFRMFKRLVGLLRLSHRWERLRFSAAMATRDPSLHPLAPFPSFDPALCARMFIRNHRLLQDYAGTLGACAITYLQPVNGLGRRRMDQQDTAGVAHLKRRVTQDGLDQTEALRQVYKEILADPFAGDRTRFGDLTPVFDELPGSAFIDHVHCSDIGYDVIARRIAKDILGQDAARPEGN